MINRIKMLKRIEVVRRIKLATKILLYGTGTGRPVTVFPDDVFIVAYPKSGSTWGRFLIGNLIHQDQPITFANLERKVPDIYQNTEDELQRVPRPRILKSHEYFDPRYRKVIYIVRDPRDVALSYYHHQVKMKTIKDGYPIGQYVSRFISGELNSFGSWAENVGSWLGARQDTSGFLLLRYEDILEQPMRELSKVASFLAINAPEERLEKAVKLSAAENMRKLEKEQADLWKPTKRSRKDKPFVRSATAGGWKTELPDSSIKEIESAWGICMKLLGYIS